MRVLFVPTPPEIRAAYGISAAAGTPPPGADLWDDWVAAQTPLTAPPLPPRSSMIYTSGTTGRPKGVRRGPPSPAMMDKIRTYYAWVFGLKPDDGIVALMNGPFYHSSPNSYVLICARFNIPAILQARFDPEEMLALIHKHRISHMHIVPAMFVRLLRLPDEVRRRYDLTSLRFVIHGAAPCPPDVKRKMIEWWGPVIYEYYGSTETGITCVHNAEEAARKPGTVGRILEGGRGELVSVGDVGWIDDDGYVFLCDRKRDMVISGGVNIYPAEIESALIGMPGVKDCAVFGIPDEEFGESLCAHIEPEANAPPPTAEAVHAFLAPRLAKYKIPRVVEIAANLPREDSGKIFKRKLRAPYWEKAGRSI
jgi:long-chain acyl-CoA synthetase